MDHDLIFKALAHPLRRQILDWLRQPAMQFADHADGGVAGVPAGRIDSLCGQSQSTVSGHLALLRRAGLVRASKLGQLMLYSRDEAAIARFLQSLPRTL